MKEFKTQSKRILDLMINSIYTNKEIFLRELISNASDAIDKLHFISLTDDSVNGDFKIEIIPDAKNKTLTITDNGIGMSESELENNLGTIAESGTLAFKSEQKYGVLLSNPPYGERLSEEKEVRTLMSGLGKTFRALPDWNAYILTSLPDFERYFGKTADKKKKLFNANLVCGFYAYHGKSPKENGAKKPEKQS